VERKTAIRNAVVMFAVALCLGSLGGSRSIWATTADQTAVIDFARMAVLRALNYDEGNRDSLIDAQGDFTPEGWSEFMKWLDGFVDAQGAPTGSSRFTITGDVVVKSQGNGVTRLSIPGTLKQESTGRATTTYRVIVDVEVSDKPLKIRHLKTKYCGTQPCE
jgi:hypothetical protein